MKWRQGLREATGYEREKLLRIEKYCAGVHLQEVVGALCDASPIGIIDCSDVSASASISRWGRYRGKVYAEFRASSSVPGGAATYRFCFNNL